MAQSPNHSITQSLNHPMFWRLWLRALTVKRPQVAVAIGSLLVGAALSSMLLNLYGDVYRKMTQEFSAYGPNVVLAPATSGSGTGGRGFNPAVTESPPKTKQFLLPFASAGLKLRPSALIPGPDASVMEEDVLGRLKPFRQRAAGLAAAPVLYVVMCLNAVTPQYENNDPRSPEFGNVVAVGADFAVLRRLNPSWRVEGLAGTLEPGTCAIGAHLATRLRLGVGDAIQLRSLSPESGVRSQRGDVRLWTPDSGLRTERLKPRQICRISSVLSTGSSEDSQVFVPLAALQRVAGLEGKISLMELSVPGEPAEVERVVRELGQAFTGLEARPVRQIVYSEGKVLGTIRWLLVSLTALIVVIVFLSVMATMTAIVLERRKDVAVMKALGASDRLVMRLFLSEVAALGLAGGIAGCCFGVLLARHLAQRLFGVTLTLTVWTIPFVCLSSILLAVLSTLFPVRMVRDIYPAQVLKGE